MHPQVTWLQTDLFTYALGFLMLSMGLTLTFDDFRRCLRNPWTVRARVPTEACDCRTAWLDTSPHLPPPPYRSSSSAYLPPGLLVIEIMTLSYSMSWSPFRPSPLHDLPAGRSRLHCPIHHQAPPRLRHCSGMWHVLSHTPRHLLMVVQPKLCIVGLCSPAL